MIKHKVYKQEGVSDQWDYIKEIQLIGIPHQGTEITIIHPEKPWQTIDVIVEMVCFMEGADYVSILVHPKIGYWEWN